MSPSLSSVTAWVRALAGGSPRPNPSELRRSPGFAGGLVTEDPQSPHYSAGSLRAGVYLGHADNDPSMTPEQNAALNAALEEAGVTHTAEVYAGARHG
jgi:carboxymethylenebutenolidase